jgi:hypothetical protein
MVKIMVSVVRFRHWTPKEWETYATLSIRNEMRGTTSGTTISETRLMPLSRLALAWVISLIRIVTGCLAICWSANSRQAIPVATCDRINPKFFLQPHV